MSDEKNVTPEEAHVESLTPLWFRRATVTAGVLALIAGVPAAIALFCLVPLILGNDSSSETIMFGVVSLTVALLTLGAGGLAFFHGNRSVQNKPSKPLRFLLSPWLLFGTFIFLLIVGGVIGLAHNSIALLFPPIFVACASLPPLWAVTWMIPRTTANDEPSKPPFLTWRRGLLSFAGGATVSVFIAIVLEILLPVIVLSLVFNLAGTLSDQVSDLFRALSNREIADALTNRSFIYIFVQIALIAPLAEELAKPLITLPLIKNANKKEAFWIGAIAGAGFATLENIIYATGGFSIWAGILLVRALGGALHPLGAGLMAQGWHGVLRGEKDAGKNWWKRFGIAVAVHAAWNGGSLLVITLGGARFFGDLPAEIDLLGLSAAGTTLAFLLILGITALWIGRSYGHDKPILVTEGEIASENEFVPSDRAVALWAVACLIALVPAGIAGLKIWLR
ncbi:MAG: PrsW family glutamic-type intramembrane protease [Anaerolineales bacterium]